MPVASEENANPTTLAPLSLAICAAMQLTAPAAADTTTVSPAYIVVLSQEVQTC